MSSNEEIFKVISPLGKTRQLFHQECFLRADAGLFDTRIRGLRDVTDRFLFMPKFQVGLAAPLKIYGVGAFTYDSYLIFR